MSEAKLRREIDRLRVVAARALERAATTHGAESTLHYSEANHALFAADRLKRALDDTLILSGVPQMAE
ncbi:MAG: hypothetical protein KDE22_06090, partial [Rhodobacterales bacterium]|nr:hypothetical protein [Rhodobacterales bacterium]